MITSAIFLVAAAVAAVVRWQVALHVNEVGRLPFGTMAVNVSGSFLLAVATRWDAPLVTVVGVAALGTYTTFSTFALELVDAGERGSWASAGLNLTLSLVAGIAAALVGLELVA